MIDRKKKKEQTFAEIGADAMLGMIEDLRNNVPLRRHEVTLPDAPNQENGKKAGR